MDFKIEVSEAGALRDIAVDALLLVVGEGTRQSHLGKPLWSLLSGALEADDFAFKAGRCLVLHRPAGVKARRVVFAAASGSGFKGWRAALVSGLNAIKSGGTAQLAVALCDGEELSAAHAQALCTAVGDSVYVYRHTKPSAGPETKLKRVLLCSSPVDAPAATQGLQRGRAIAAGIALARECANRPGNHLTPTHLAAEATRLGKSHGLDVEVLDRKDVNKLGMGSFVAVAQGSSEPLKFIVMSYKGAAKTSAPVVLVGKGITFDTGGISIKPAADMDEMKFDMGGAASVLGTLRAIAELKPKINVVGLIPACENMPSGDAIKPGDVVTSLSGQTIEILNTDAEGRLILCDALTYAERFKPAAVIDIATLTGACVVALGHHRSGLFCADDALAEELDRAGQRALDPCWRMPLDDEYDDALKSNFADMANVGPRAGGAITAAMFLKRFTARYPWAHLDIAGSAWKSGPAKGSTGRPVGLLCEFVLSRAG